MLSKVLGLTKSVSVILQTKQLDLISAVSEVCLKNMTIAKRI